jgi:formate dehydrogenase (coenzyme F420) beta subunit
MNASQAIQADAARLLSEGRVKLVIGFRLHDGRGVPAFVTDPADAATLYYGPECLLNLAAYLSKPEVRQQGPVALVASPTTLRSLIVLAAESQIADGAVVALAVGPDEYHGAMDIAAAAELVRTKYASPADDGDLLKRLAELRALPPAGRAAFWREQFAKCTRCYACRAACPGCYCQRCAVEKNMPQWISTAAAGHGNYAWHIIRAFHQAGRCVLCGACQAACPQGIPLMLLNAQIDLDVQEEFQAKSGLDPAGKPVMGTWRPDDKDEFIR